MVPVTATTGPEMRLASGVGQVAERVQRIRRPDTAPDRDWPGCRARTTAPVAPAAAGLGEEVVGVEAFAPQGHEQRARRMAAGVGGDAGDGVDGLARQAEPAQTESGQRITVHLAVPAPGRRPQQLRHDRSLVERPLLAARSPDRSRAPSRRAAPCRPAVPSRARRDRRAPVGEAQVGCAGGSPATMSSMIASGFSVRGLSEVTTVRSASAPASAAMIGRLPRSRSPPQPKSTIRRPGVSGRSALQRPLQRVGGVGVVAQHDERRRGQPLHPTGHLGGAGQSLDHLVQRQPEAESHGRRSEGIGDVELARAAAAHASRLPERPSIRNRLPLAPSAGSTARTSASGARPKLTDAAVRGIASHAGSSAFARHHRVLRQQPEQLELGGEVVLHGPVIVEVVAREVGEDRRPRRSARPAGPGRGCVTRSPSRRGAPRESRSAAKRGLQVDRTGRGERARRRGDAPPRPVERAERADAARRPRRG